MKNKNNKYVVLGIVILVSLIGLGSYYLGIQKKISSSTIPASNDTVKNWKIYTDSGSGFSLKYPGDYFKYPGNPPGGLYVATLAPIGGNGPKFLDDDALWLSVSATESTLTLDQYISTQEAVTDSIYKNAQKVQFTIDGVPSYKITFSYQAFPAGNSKDNTVTSTTIYNFQNLIIKGGKVYTISLSAYNEKLLNSRQIMYDQILSTFKFMPPSDSQNYMSAMSILQEVPEIQALQKDLIKLGRTTLFKAGDEDGDLVKIWLYEDGIPDGHITRIDTFNVNIKTKAITVDDVAMISGKEFITLEEWKKTVKGRFQ